MKINKISIIIIMCFIGIERTTEVDYVLKADNTELPIEANFQNKTERKHFKELNY